MPRQRAASGRRVVEESKGRKHSDSPRHVQGDCVVLAGDGCGLGCHCWLCPAMRFAAITLRPLGATGFASAIDAEPLWTALAPTVQVLATLNTDCETAGGTDISPPQISPRAQSRSAIARVRSTIVQPHHRTARLCAGLPNRPRCSNCSDPPIARIARIMIDAGPTAVHAPY
jgi:hypothetical protein